MKRQGIYFKEQGYLLELKGNNAAKLQEVTGRRSVKALWLLWILFLTLCVCFMPCLFSLSV